jgi:hypothetical protein
VEKIFIKPSVRPLPHAAIRRQLTAAQLLGNEVKDEE